MCAYVCVCERTAWPDGEALGTGFPSRERDGVPKWRVSALCGGILREGFGEYEKGIWWMPWRQEAMKDVARCDKPWGAASRL